jgi:27-O-demethylrifamycin SV methyltransferase
MTLDAKEHYEHVTDAWKHFMGDNLHFGYFESEDMELSRATDLLTEKMLELCDIDANTRVLDVGCGIGKPAFYIHEKYGCAIEGISTSERGIQLANEASRQRGYDKKVKFKVADGLKNGYPKKTFDLVWVMESSHLMGDKNKLVKECSRVLKDGGTLVLCDLIMLVGLKRLLLFTLTNRKHLKELEKAFGPGRMNKLGLYCDACVKAGFREVTALNITEQASPTPARWKENAQRFLDEEMGDFSRQDVQDFITACDFLDRCYKKGVFGYGIVRAKK